MNRYLESLNLTPAIFFQVKTYAVVLPLEVQSYQLIINGLIVLAIILLILLLLVMSKSLRSLQESASDDKQNAKVWISRKLYDFDAEQLKILIKKINKSGKNDQQIES